MKREMLTWVEAVTGDRSSLKPLCKLMCEQHVAQLTVAVYPEAINDRVAFSKFLVSAKEVKVKVPKIMTH